MDTLTVALADTCPVLLGSRSFSAFGFTSVDVTRKKISSRNTMSVMDDIENSDNILVFLLIAISFQISVPEAVLQLHIRFVQLLEIHVIMDHVQKIGRGAVHKVYQI